MLSIVQRGPRLWLLAELAVAAGSRADGMRTAVLEESGELRVLAVRHRGGERWRPEHPDRLEAGHEVLLAGTRERCERVRELAAP